MLHNTVDGDPEEDRHARAVRIVAEAVFGLVGRFAEQGVTPEAVLEGSVRGSAIALTAYRGVTPQEVADLLGDLGDAFRDIDLPAGGRIGSLSETPVADLGALSNAHIQLADGTNWVPLNAVASQLRSSIADLAATAVPAVEDLSEEVSQRLQQMTRRVDDLNTERIRLHGLQQLKLADIQSLRRRIASLDEDLQKNLDVQRLQRYSGVTAALTPDRCPTCEQALADTLLAQEALSAVMPVSDNIEYIRSQKKMFEGILVREEKDENDRREQLAAVARQLSDHYAQIRLLRSAKASVN